MRSFRATRPVCHPDIVTETSEVARMDKADRGSFYALGSALGARNSRNRVSWLSAHLLDFPAHEAYRKELSYDPSSTLSLVRKWGPKKKLAM